MSARRLICYTIYPYGLYPMNPLTPLVTAFLFPSLTFRTKQEEEAQAFAARQAERLSTADAKTAKNRAKRQKRKGNGNKSTKADDSPLETEDKDGAGGGSKKRKLAGGNGLVFKRPGEESSDDDQDGDENENAGKIGLRIPELETEERQHAETVPIVEEVKIAIVDDD